ncbi:hypothetical protein VNO80_01217 [Phaseolus coccineus]|uniref:Uncharacterized protein n=1 Tax=Phaseolus coccineus TaxID=3886 RepID=A0AAN9P0D5_PHACN
MSLRHIPTTELIREVEELMSFKQIQIQNNCYLEEKLREAELKIQHLMDRCKILESASNLIQTQVEKTVIQSHDEPHVDPKETLFVKVLFDGESCLSSIDLYWSFQHAIKSLYPMNSTSMTKLNYGSYNPTVYKWTLCPSLDRKKGSLTVVSLTKQICSVVDGVYCINSFVVIEVLDLDIRRWISACSKLHKIFAIAGVGVNTLLLCNSEIEYLKFDLDDSEDESKIRMISSISVFHPSLFLANGGSNKKTMVIWSLAMDGVSSDVESVEDSCVASPLSRDVVEPAASSSSSGYEGIMASLVPPGGKKDYFRQLRLKRQAQKAEREGMPGGSATPVVEAAVPITTVPAAEAVRPPSNPKRRKEDRGKSSRRHGERSSSGRSPKRGRLTGGPSSSGPDFLGHELNVAEKVSIKLNPYQQDAYLSARPSQVHDAFMELCSRTLVLGKRMASDLMKRDKNAAEVRVLQGKLDESSANLQSALAENTNLLSLNLNLEAEMRKWREKCELAERTGREVAVKADEEIRGLTESLSDMALTHHRSEERVEKLLKELEVAEDSVLEEHEAGFKKALRQAAFFYNTPLDEGKFDVDKDIHNGELLPLDQIPNSPQAAVSAPSQAPEVENIESDS